MQAMVGLISFFKKMFSALYQVLVVGVVHCNIFDFIQRKIFLSKYLISGLSLTPVCVDTCVEDMRLPQVYFVVYHLQMSSSLGDYMLTLTDEPSV